MVAWGYLVYAAIDFGSTARGGDPTAWWFLALASVGAVACLFFALMLVVRLLRRLGITTRRPPRPAEAPVRPGARPSCPTTGRAAIGAPARGAVDAARGGTAWPRPSSSPARQPGSKRLTNVCVGRASSAGTSSFWPAMTMPGVERVEPLDPVDHGAHVAVVGGVGGDAPEGVAGCRP